LVGSGRAAEPLAAAFRDAHMDEQVAPVMKDLLLQRFARPKPQLYDVLRQDFAVSLRFWRRHPLARSVHLGFAEIQTQPVSAGESR
jgi:hypothetical protein